LNQQRIEKLKNLKPKISNRKISKASGQDIVKYIQNLVQDNNYKVWGLSATLCRFWNEDHPDLEFTPQHFRIYFVKAKAKAETQDCNNQR
jgi:hypothetical protein